MTAVSLEWVFDRLGLAPSEAQAQALRDYLALLQRWNSTYNLTAVRDPHGMLVQHLADCLALIGPLSRRMPRGRLLDVGSGGGLPGVIVATLMPALDVTCVDAVGKKVAFVRQVAGALRLDNLHGVHGRIEQLNFPAVDVITSRAFASLPDLVQLTRHLLRPDGFWLAMKGRRPDDEMAALPAAIDVFHVEPLIVPGLEDAQRCLVWMRERALPAPVSA